MTWLQKMLLAEVVAHPAWGWTVAVPYSGTARIYRGAFETRVAAVTALARWREEAHATKERRAA
jgi:hypothetical protein